MTVTPAAPSGTYSFDNDDPDAANRHNYLPAMLDGLTTSRLASIGDLTGKRCLELGAGGGSVARWLASRVGPAGRVLATDINTRHLRTDPGYEVLPHDLVSEPVPAGPWDVIHARLVLLHMPQRGRVLRRLASALAPGGALALEELETTIRKRVWPRPTPRAAELYRAVPGRRCWTSPAHQRQRPDLGRPGARRDARGGAGRRGHVGTRPVLARRHPGRAADRGEHRRSFVTEFLDPGFTAAELDELIASSTTRGWCCAGTSPIPPSATGRPA